MRTLVFTHIPETWVAIDHPWTFVITQTESGRYAASAKNSSSILPKARLGTTFLSLDDAQEACRAHQRKHRQ